MAVIECEIIPRRNIKSEELRKLGAALAQWCGRESADDGLLHFISRDNLANLTSGLGPQSFLAQYQNMLDEANALFSEPQQPSAAEKKQRFLNLKQQFGEKALRRTIYLQVRGGVYSTRQRIITSLKQDIPAELVEDVLIGERSWDEGN